MHVRALLRHCGERVPQVRVNVMQRESCMGANECRKNERNDKLRKYEQHEGARV